MIQSQQPFVIGWGGECLCLSVLGTLAHQVFVQLFLHVIGHFSCHGAELGICHPAGEVNDKVNILCHLRSAHHSGGVIAVMDGGSVVGGNPGEGYRGNALVGKGKSGGDEIDGEATLNRVN